MSLTSIFSPFDQVSDAIDVIRIVVEGEMRHGHEWQRYGDDETSVSRRIDPSPTTTVHHRSGIVVDGDPMPVLHIEIPEPSATTMRNAYVNEVALRTRAALRDMLPPRTCFECICGAH